MLNRVKINAFLSDQEYFNDMGYDLCRFLLRRRCRLVELSAGMNPAGHFDDTVLTEQFITAAVGISRGG